MPGMILLKPGNRILEETFRSQLAPEGARDAIDVRLCDFDDVSYRVQVEKDDMDMIKFSMGLPCWHAIKDKGGEAALEKHYGEWKAESEVGFDISLHIKISEVKDIDAAVNKLQLFKATITGSVFDFFFQGLLDGTKNDKFQFDLRGDTTVYMVPRDDRVTVIFSCDFSENVDKVIAKVFLQELQDGRKKINRAPPTMWGTNPPSELSEFGITENQGCLGYISFAILPSHIKPNEEKKRKVVDTLQTFRTFLQYHIKASKTHFHTKMRKRVIELQKVLNRAKEENTKKEKKTVGGKTFKRG